MEQVDVGTGEVVDKMEVVEIEAVVFNMEGVDAVFDGLELDRP